ncbi:MAG TPA: hypothetical protein VI731_05760 [Bacteroidia bacterium]|nr:hypothetical protein [Bacteroidia bacterium]
MISKKSIFSGTFIIAVIVTAGFGSCKGPGTCEAYQGSGKGTRSFKPTKHRSAVVIKERASFRK